MDTVRALATPSLYIRSRILALAGAALALAIAPSIRAQQPAAPDSASSALTHRATVTKYCVTCHNDRTKAGGLALDKMDFDNIPAGAAVWEKSLKKMRVGMMP